MSSLNRNQIYKILKETKLKKNKSQLLNYLNQTKKRFFQYSKESSNSLGNEKYVNPLQWQIGHVIFFYSNLILKNLKNCPNISYIENYNQYVDFYDSFKTPLKNRNGNLLLDSNVLYQYYNNIINILIDYINNNDLCNIESYLIMLGILHNEMHNEAFIFTKLSITNIIDFEINPSNDKLIENIIFIKYNQNKFIQGINDDNNFLIFDNEKPCFESHVNNFEISQYPITEFQYLQFILNNGYKNEKLWCRNGWKWKEENNIKVPLYWIKKDLKYYKKINNKLISIETNLPVVNISYYEASAFCKWKKGRLPLEKEYEFVTTNEGKTFFPWGNNINNMNDICNLNYNNYIKPVNEYKEGNNLKGVSQLIGNVWEWCEEPIYPYNGFTIDPVYREMSYPFFGFKKICKGGCFAVPDYLIHPKYRNAQYPDCRIQFIGFRICKDI